MIWEDLRQRGLIHQSTIGTEQWLNSQKEITFYCGFDPTADSLHVGSLLPIITIKRLANAGLKPLLLLGSATAMIGDPSGKTTERKLLSKDTVEENILKINHQFQHLMGTQYYETYYNDGWLEKIDIIDYLRNVGKHFSVNMMLARDCVKSRLEDGISFTEFAYMTLQANDFKFLFQRCNCQLQIGGSDQWGNITLGIELIRKVYGANAYGFTIPLLTTSDGKKFGKSEEGNIWLDPKKTHPYFFYKHFLYTEDEDAEKFLKMLTFCSIDEINALEPRERQITLAKTLTQFVHDQTIAEACAGLETAMHKQDPTEIKKHAAALNLLENEPPNSPIISIPRENFKNGGMSVIHLGILSGLFDSNGDCRREIERLNSGFWVGNFQVKNTTDLVQAPDGEFMFLRRGKRNKRVIRVF